MSSHINKIVNNEWIPWRLRNQLEIWTERKLRPNCNWIYQLFHFGRIREVVRPITKGPMHHFFGYYEKSPWDKSGKYILSHEVNFNNRAPTERDSLKIGIIETTENYQFTPLAMTKAWNWQQGSMLQWYPSDGETLIMHNDRIKNQFVGVIRNLCGKELFVFDRPFYAVTPDGKYGLSLNFSRLHKYRPGYGYAGIADPWGSENCPKDDGVFLMDLESGCSQLILPLEKMVKRYQEKNFQALPHWINHIQINPSGNRFAFFLLWDKGSNQWGVKLFTSTMDGSDVNCILNCETISHYDWRDDENILIWAKESGSKGNFILCNIFNKSVGVVGKDVLTQDGHCSFSCDRKWVLNDTYPDLYDMRTLMVFRVDDAKRIDITRLYSPKEKWWGETRCDLHPRWSRDDKSICIDSVHTGERQMYIVNIEKLLNG